MLRDDFINVNKMNFLDINMRWHPKGDLQFGIFSKKVRHVKYIIKFSTHTPGTLCVIPSVVLNHLAKIISLNPDLNFKELNSVYPDHAKSLRKAGPDN